MSLGNFIKKVREEKGYTQEQVAARGGLARSYISRMEDDDFKSPSAMHLIRLAEGLGVSHETIFQVAGYLAHVKKDSLPSFDAYLRSKYDLSEGGIKKMEEFREFVEAQEKNESNKK